MATPAPGSYTYPVGPTGSGVAGHPEVYSFWVFVFFNPEACGSDPCGPMDLINDPDVIAGAFNAGGHVTGGQNLTLAGSVNRSRATFGGPNAETIGTALDMGYDLASADIHLAVAPHGALDPALLPELDLDAGRWPGPLVDLDLPATAVKNSDAAGGFPARGTPAVSG